MKNCNVSFLPMVRALSGQAEDSKGDEAIRMVYSRHLMKSEDFLKGLGDFLVGCSMSHWSISEKRRG